MLEPIHKTRPDRSQNVAEQKDYKLYRRSLREDFNNSCGYCDDSDELHDSIVYQIDHFAPYSKFPDLKTVYENLVYSCRFCNNKKRANWATNDPTVSVKDNEGFIDPCSIEYDEHLKRDFRGKIVALTPLGNYMVEKLNLGLVRHELLWKVRHLLEKREQIKNLQQELTEDSQFGSESYKLLDELVDKYLHYLGFVRG